MGVCMCLCMRVRERHYKENERTISKLDSLFKNKQEMNGIIFLLKVLIGAASTHAADISLRAFKKIFLFIS